MSTTKIYDPGCEGRKSAAVSVFSHPLTSVRRTFTQRCHSCDQYKQETLSHCRCLFLTTLIMFTICSLFSHSFATVTLFSIGFGLFAHLCLKLLMRLSITLIVEFLLSLAAIQSIYLFHSSYGYMNAYTIEQLSTPYLPLVGFAPKRRKSKNLPKSPEPIATNDNPQPSHQPPLLSIKPEENLMLSQLTPIAHAHSMPPVTTSNTRLTEQPIHKSITTSTKTTTSQSTTRPPPRPQNNIPPKQAITSQLTPKNCCLYDSILQLHKRNKIKDPFVWEPKFDQYATPKEFTTPAGKKFISYGFAEVQAAVICSYYAKLYNYAPVNYYKVTISQKDSTQSTLHFEPLLRIASGEIQYSSIVDLDWKNGDLWAICQYHKLFKMILSGSISDCHFFHFDFEEYLYPKITEIKSKHSMDIGIVIEPFNIVT